MLVVWYNNTLHTIPFYGNDQMETVIATEQVNNSTYLK